MKNVEAHNPSPQFLSWEIWAAYERMLDELESIAPVDSKSSYNSIADLIEQSLQQALQQHLQRDAHTPMLAILGLPGSGKSHVIREIVQLATVKGIEIDLITAEEVDRELAEYFTQKGKPLNSTQEMSPSQLKAWAKLARKHIQNSLLKKRNKPTLVLIEMVGLKSRTLDGTQKDRGSLVIKQLLKNKELKDNFKGLAMLCANLKDVTNDFRTEIRSSTDKLAVMEEKGMEIAVDSHILTISEVRQILEEAEDSDDQQLKKIADAILDLILDLTRSGASAEVLNSIYLQTVLEILNWLNMAATPTRVRSLSKGSAWLYFLIKYLKHVISDEWENPRYAELFYNPRKEKVVASAILSPDTQSPSPTE